MSRRLEKVIPHEEVRQNDADILVLEQYAIGDPHPNYAPEKALAALKRAIEFALKIEQLYGTYGVDSIFYLYGNMFPAELAQLKELVTTTRQENR